MHGVADRLGRRIVRSLCAGALFLTLATSTVACAATQTASPTPTVNPLSRIHNMGPDTAPLFVRVTFTPTTTYQQAVAIVQNGPTPAHVYPWTCDDPRTPTPPSDADLRAAFEGSASFKGAHSVLLSYAPWDAITRIAASPQVVSIEPDALYQCS